MKRITLGKTNPQVSPLCIGTWQLAGENRPNYQSATASPSLPPLGEEALQTLAARADSLRSGRSN